MSKYTTEIRYILESLAGLDESEGYNSINTIISNSRELFFDFDYPIFDENYRSVLETKILKHFYTREIGTESYGLFKLYLDSKMNEIMPYYNQLYNSELLKFDPFIDTNYKSTMNKTDSGTANDTGSDTTITEDHGTIHTTGAKINDDRTNKTDGFTDGKTYSESETSQADSTGSSTATVNGRKTGNSTDLYSDTPQGAITGLENGDHLTNARLIDNVETEATTTGTEASTHGEDSKTKTGSDTLTHSGTASETFNGNEQTNTNTADDKTTTTTGSNTKDHSFDNISNYIEDVFGKRNGMTYSQMLKEFRETFLNIDVEILKDLEPLFMGLW